MWHPTNEVWLPVQKHPKYEVSNLGRIRKKNKWPNKNKTTKYRYFKGGFTNHGYHFVKLNLKTRFVAHLVLEAFVGPRPPGFQCDHINHIRDDNRMVNLRWVTISENNKHRRPFSEKWRLAQKQRVRPRDPKTGQFIKSL